MYEKIYDKSLVDTPEKALSIINEIIDVNKRLEEEIDYFRYDDLTGFMLRKDHNHMLQIMYRDMVKFNIPFMYAHVDLNGLHDINRKSGYLVGDSFIKSAADQLRDSFKESHIFRIGGDEFALIMKGDCDTKFGEILSSIDNSEYGHVCVTPNKFTDMEAVIEYVDNIVIEKKANRNAVRQ